MTSEQQFLICVLSDFCAGRESSTPDAGFDWDRFNCLVQSQSIGSVVYQQGKHWPLPPEIRQSLQHAFYSDVFLDVNRGSSLTEIAEKCNKEGITILPFKGWIVRQYWPVPSLRSMGDVDLLIHPEDRKRCDEILLSLGFERFVDHQNVWTYYDKELIFEVHDHMFYEYLANDVDYRGFFDKAWDYVTPTLDPGFHLLYLITHMAKHVINKGVGFRFFLDLVFLCRAEEGQLNWNRITEQLESLKLLDFTKICFALCERWFCVKMPLDKPGLDESFYEAATEKVFADGIFGLENKENEAARSAKDLKRATEPQWMAVWKLTWKKIFPPYADMQLIPWYSFVDGKPWLMPAAWVYRWFYCLVHKRKEGADLLAEPFAKKEIIAERQDWLRQWGL